MKRINLDIPSGISFEVQYFCGPDRFLVKFDGITHQGTAYDKDLNRAINDAYQEFYESYKKWYEENNKSRKYRMCYDEDGYIPFDRLELISLTKDAKKD